MRLIRRRRRDPDALRAPTIDPRTREIYRDFRSGLTGRKGELQVSRRLAELGLPALHDVLLEIDGRVTQIDHLVRCEGAIAVLETKAWSGDITGAIGNGEWQQKLDGGRIETFVTNPIRQNRLHVAAVRELFTRHAVEVPISDHVVMTGHATLSVELRDHVLGLTELELLATPQTLPAAQYAAMSLAWALLCDAAHQGENLRARHEQQIAARRPG